MVQLWIDIDDDVDLVGLFRRRDSTRCAGSPSSTPSSTTPTARAATCCRPRDGHVYGVDHGVTFHVEDKLRTVLWHWAGRPLPDEAVDALAELRARLDGALGERLHELLTMREVRRTRRRVDRLLRPVATRSRRRLAGHPLAADVAR